MDAATAEDCLLKSESPLYTKHCHSFAYLFVGDTPHPARRRALDTFSDAERRRCA